MNQETGLDDFNSGLLAFLGCSPTPYHATANLASLLAAQGFQILDEAQPWQLSPGGRYESKICDARSQK